MGTPTCQKLHCHLFVKLFSHTGKIMVFFPQGKGTLPAGTVKILFSLIYRAAAKRADANLFPRMESLQFFLRYFFTSLHDSFYKFCNPFQKLFAIKLPLSIKSRRFSHSAVMAADFRYVGITAVNAFPSTVGSICFPLRRA